MCKSYIAINPPLATIRSIKCFEICFIYLDEIRKTFNMSKTSTIPGLAYLPARENPSKTAADFLKARRKIDGAEELWRIGNKLYDLETFAKSHPGGSEWLQLTKGTDITELFEVLKLELSCTISWLSSMNFLYGEAIIIFNSSLLRYYYCFHNHYYNYFSMTLCVYYITKCASLTFISPYFYRFHNLQYSLKNSESAATTLV